VIARATGDSRVGRGATCPGDVAQPASRSHPTILTSTIAVLLLGCSSKPPPAPSDAATPSSCAGSSACGEGQVCSLDRCTTRACNEEENRGTSFSGCLFYAVEGDNVSADLGFATSLLVTNPSSEVARTEVQARPTPEADWTAFAFASIPPLSSHRFSLLGRQVGAPGISRAAAIRLSTDRPVTVVQVQSDDRERTSTSSAGTVLLPVHVLGPRYRAVAITQNTGAALDSSPESRGGAARVLVVGAQGRAATFRFMPSAPALVGAIGVEPLLPARQSRTFRLEDGDVFQAYSVNDDHDLSGSEIVAEGGAVVAVFSGNISTLYGQEVTGIHSPDAVHEQLLPTASWGTSLVALALPPQGDTCDTLFGAPGASMWKIVADLEGTEIRFSAPATVTGLPFSPVLLGAGQVLELLVSGGSFSVEANQPIHMMQALDCEPSLAPAVGTEHLMEDLRFAVLPAFDYVVGVVRPRREPIALNGMPISDGLFAPAGGDMEAAALHLTRCRAEDEVCTHRLTGKFGMTLRGMDVVCGYALTAPSWSGCPPTNPTCVP
jgi:hypothetical protein